MDKAIVYSKADSKGRFLPVRDLSVILSIALVAYLLVWWIAGLRDNAYMQIDSLDYLFLGKTLFETGEFTSLFRTPIFPAFAGFWNDFVGLSTAQFILVQIAMAVANIALIGRAVSFFVDQKWQKIVMLVFALDLVTIQVANWVLSETLFSFLLLVSLNVFLTIWVKQRFNVLLAISCGLCFGLFALCRPVGQFLILLLLCLMFFPKEAQEVKVGWSRKLLVCVLILVTHTLVFSAWKYHNYVKTGHSFVSTTMSYNMYNWRAAWNIAYRDGRTFESVKDEMFALRADFSRANPQLSEYEVSQEMTKQGLEIILSTPKETVAQAIRGMFFLYGGIYNGSLNRIFVEPISKRVMQAYSLIYWLIVYLGILFALLRFKSLTPNERHLFLFSGLIIGYFTFFSIGVESYARLRAPFVPYLVVCAVLGWKMFIQNSRVKGKLLG